MVELSPASEDDGEQVVPLVDGLLCRGELTHYVGPHGSGKSFNTTALVYHVATERPWRRHPTHQHLCVYVCPHDGGETRRRLRALAQHHGQPLPAHLRIVKDDIRVDPEGLADAITDLEPEHGPCGLVGLDYGHVLSPDWQALGDAAQTLRDLTGAAVILQQEGAAIASSPGWDNLWRGQRSLDDLFVLSVEHMRRSGTVGRLTFQVEPAADSAVLTGTSKRPTLRPKHMSPQLDLVVDALVAHCLAAGDWSLDLHDLVDVVVASEAYSFEGLAPKRITEKIKRGILATLRKHKIVRVAGPNLLVNSAWRKARIHQDLDDLAETLHDIFTHEEVRFATAPERKILTEPMT